MDEDVFLAEVQRQTGLATLQEAHDVTRVVLHSLAERLPDGWAHNLAAELPAEIAWPDDVLALAGRAGHDLTAAMT